MSGEYDVDDDDEFSEPFDGTTYIDLEAQEREIEALLEEAEDLDEPSASQALETQYPWLREIYRRNAYRDDCGWLLLEPNLCDFTVMEVLAWIRPISVASLMALQRMKISGDRKLCNLTERQRRDLGDFLRSQPMSSRW